MVSRPGRTRRATIPDRRRSRAPASLVLAAVAFALTASADATSSVQQSKFAAADGTFLDYFGGAAALSGDTALVGAFNKNADQGAAYVFARDVGGWTQQTRLAASDTAADDDFGIAVAVDGDVAAVGADLKNHAAGAVYVFARSSGVWTQEGKLVSDDAVSGDYFGTPIALSGSTLVVGAFNKNNARGAAYVFVRGAGGAWTQQAKLVADDGADQDAFGSSVVVDGDTALVGAYGPNGGAGGVYVFTRVGAAWTLSAKLAADDGVSGDFFGSAVAVRGTTALVGAYAATGDLGAAYVFTTDGSTWTKQGKLAAADGQARDFFGTSVALAGDTAVVGADYHDGARGAAYVFKRLGATWSAVAKLVADDAADGDHLGYSVAVDGGSVLAGAYGKSGQTGAAYVFTGIPDASPPVDPPPPSGPPVTPPTFGIQTATPMRLSPGTSIVVVGTGFSEKPRAWLDMNGRRIALHVEKGAMGARLVADLTSVPRHAFGACTLNVLPLGSKTPYTLDGLSIELPDIASAAPASTADAVHATIAGSFFGSRKGRVRLGGRRCGITSWSDTSITVRVPRAIAHGDAVNVEVGNQVGVALTLNAFTR